MTRPMPPGNPGMPSQVPPAGVPRSAPPIPVAPAVGAPQQPAPPMTSPAAPTATEARSRRSTGRGADASTEPAGPKTPKPKKIRGIRKPPRMTSLQLKRVDPWTVLKISLIVSVVMFFVWMIAIGLLYLLFSSMDVFDTVNDAFGNLFVSDNPNQPQGDLITPIRVFGVAGIIGAVNIVLFTALSAIGAFVYNAAAGMAGGVELTLGERD